MLAKNSKIIVTRGGSCINTKGHPYAYCICIFKSPPTQCIALFMLCWVGVGWVVLLITCGEYIVWWLFCWFWCCRCHMFQYMVKVSIVHKEFITFIAIIAFVGSAVITSMLLLLYHYYCWYCYQYFSYCYHKIIFTPYVLLIFTNFILNIPWILLLCK